MIIGKEINIREATKDDQTNRYQWVSNKDIVKAMRMGEDFPENPLIKRRIF